jgi:hypothetical protein
MHKRIHDFRMRQNSFHTKMLKYLIFIILLCGSFISVRSSNIPQNDTVLVTTRTITGEELIRGQRLFYGLVYLQDKTINCAGCHNTVESDTLNWNPNALEISLKYKDKSPADLSRILLKPSGAKMIKSHKNFELTSEDIVLLKAYMDKFTEIGLKKSKPVITNLLLFIIAIILFLFALSDLVLTKILKQRWIHQTILFITTVFITYTLVITGLAIGRSKDYMPDQPVKFSHKVHAGQNGTDCIYCHSSAPYSKSAGIPPVNVCMNCHLIVRNGTRSGSIEISKVIKAYDEKVPIKWVKVYNLPDHVFFSHAQHVGAGQVSCQTCHGKVQENDVITQVPDLSMGWCINCHRTTKVNFSGNLFYSDYKELAEKLKKGEIDSVTVDMIGGIECMKCHY